MNRLQRFALVMLLGSCAMAQAETNCDEAQTTADMERCAKTAFDETEARLNDTYRQVMSFLKQPDMPGSDYAAARQKILSAQRSWVAFREADCEARYILVGSGSLRNIVLLNCRQQRAEQRIDELQQVLPL